MPREPATCRLTLPDRGSFGSRLDNRIHYDDQAVKSSLHGTLRDFDIGFVLRKRILRHPHLLLG